MQSLEILEVTYPYAQIYDTYERKKNGVSSYLTGYETQIVMATHLMDAFQELKELPNKKSEDWGDYCDLIDSALNRTLRDNDLIEGYESQDYYALLMRSKIHPSRYHRVWDNFIEFAPRAKMNCPNKVYAAWEKKIKRSEEYDSMAFMLHTDMQLSELSIRKAKLEMNFRNGIGIPIVCRLSQALLDMYKRMSYDVLYGYIPDSEELRKWEAMRCYFNKSQERIVSKNRGGFPMGKHLELLSHMRDGNHKECMKIGFMKQDAYKFAVWTIFFRNGLFDFDIEKKRHSYRAENDRKRKIIIKKYLYLLEIMNVTLSEETVCLKQEELKYLNV